MPTATGEVLFRELFNLLSGPFVLALTTIALVMAGIGYAFAEQDKSALYRAMLGACGAIFALQIVAALTAYFSIGENAHGPFSGMLKFQEPTVQRSAEWQAHIERFHNAVKEGMEKAKKEAEAKKGSPP